MDIEEFRKNQVRKYAEAEERRKRRRRRLRIWLRAILIFLAAAVSALVIYRLIGQVY